MQHTASFKEGSGGDRSFKPSASTPKNAFITLQRQVPQLHIPSLESATSSSDVRI